MVIQRSPGSIVSMRAIGSGLSPAAREGRQVRVMRPASTAGEAVFIVGSSARGGRRTILHAPAPFDSLDAARYSPALALETKMTPTPKGPAVPRRRKGAIRMSAIPASVLRDLNAGRDETITLVEWLAVDIRALAGAVLPRVGLIDGRREVLAAAGRLARQG